MIDNMDFDDFDEYGFQIFPIIAFGKNPYAGKNSKIQRSLRARAQRRDRYGRFAFMFGGMGFDYFDNNGNIQTALGTYVGAADQDGYLQIFVENDPILGTGVFNAKENNASQYIANLSPEQLKKAGIEVGKDASGKAITARDKKIIPTIAELHRQDAPEGWTKNDDGTYTSEDNAYKITPPAGKSKSWTLQELDDNGDAKDKGTTHRGFGAALKDVNERDTKALLSPDDNQKLAELQDDLAAAEDTETDGDEIAEDQKQSEIDSIQKKIDDILNKGELDETAAEEAPAEQEEDVQDDGQAPKAKKQAAVGVEDTRANTPGNLETRWGRQLGPAMKRAQGAITLFMQQNKANNRPATTKEVSDLFTAIDNAFLDRGQSMRYDADVDAFQELSKEYFGLDADIARAEKAGNTQLVSDLKGRKKEVGTQVSALQQAISTRYQNRAPLADEPTVDVSTNFPEVTEFVPPSYKKARGKGRPKGTGKNQIAAKQAEEAQKAQAPAPEAPADVTPAIPETTPTPSAEAPTTSEPDGSRRTSIDDWAGEQLLSDWQDGVSKYTTDGNNLSDHALATAEMQGMDGAPQTLSDDEFDAFDGETLFRGFDSEDSKQKFYEDENWIGSGGNGTGIYTSTSKSHAGRYGNFDDSRIVDLKLRPDAVIMDVADLETRRKADFEKAMAEDNLLGAQLASGDLGIYATAIGVDGYRADLEGFPSVVLTNREAVVARKSDTATTSDTTSPEATPVAEAPTPEERKAEAEAKKAEAEARKAEAEADKAEAEVPAPVEEEATPAPAAKKQGQVADAPETGTTKTGTRSRVQNSKELDNAPAGTVVHRFSGNGTFDDSAFGTAGRDLLGEPSYIDSIIKGEDGEWYRISPKTGNPESKALNARALRLNANDSYGSSMVFDKPDDGSTPETMYAQAAKAKADAEAARAARKTETAEPAVAETPEAPAAEEAKPEEVAPAQPKGMTPAEYTALLENPFLDSEQVAPAVIDKYDNEAGELRALFDSGADGAALVAKAREISPAFVAEDDFQALQNKRINAGQRPSGADNNRVSLHNRELGALGRLPSDTPESRAELAKLPSKEKDAYGKVVGDKIYGMELDALPAGARIKSIPHTRADGSMGFGYLTKQEDGTWTYDSDGLVATNIKAIADRNRTAYAGSPEPEAVPAAEEVAPAEEVTPDVTPEADVAAEPAEGTSELEADTADAPTTEAEVAEADAIEPTADETAAEAGADLDLITTRTTDEDYADEAYLPTEEQRNVIDAAVSELDVSVQALAGSGKTSTLVLAAKQLLKYHPDKKILYIAFNKTVQLEAEDRMPSENTEARTGDSLGWWGVDSSIRTKMGKGDALPKKIADHLGIPTTDKNREDLAHDLTKVIEQYSISDSDDISKDHFDAAEVEFSDKALAYAQMYWADLNDANGQIRLTNSHLTKMWALTKPDLGQAYGGGRNSFGKADVIFFDEAQDINPVMAKVIRDQTIQKIYVGDSNQAIYGFRGADDELDKVETDITLPMTRTFRFGQTLAGPGNRMLSLLKSKYKIVGAGKTDGTVVPTGSMADADAVLTRTNGGRFTEIIQELEKGRVVGLSRADKADAERMLATVRWLMFGGTKPYPPHEDFDGYTSWKQVSNDVMRKKASGKVETISNIFTNPNNNLDIASISDALSKVKVISEDKNQTPIDYSDGASGAFGVGVNYSIVDNGDGNLAMTVSGGYRQMQPYISLFRPSAFKYDATSKTYTMVGTPEEIKDTVDGIRGVPASDVDVIVSTAHKAKGLEWGKVRIGDDFRGPEPDEEGNLVFPEKQELNLAYVALTRAESELDPGSLAWVYDYTSDEDEDPTTESRGLPDGVTQAGQPVPATEEAEEAPTEPETAPAAEEVIEDVVEDVAEPVGTEENPATPAEPVEAPAEEQPAGPSEPAPEVLAPVEKKADAPLIRNEDQSNLDPAPAETTDTGVEGVSNDPQVIADTYDNKDLVDALVTAVQNDEPGINIEGENGNTAIVPVENVRDALQKQGTNTNDVIDEALGEPEVQSVPAEILSTDDSKPSENTVKRFQLNNLLATREVPKENKDAIDLISTDPSATDEQIDWAISILDDQPDLLSTPKAQLPQLSKDIVDVQVDPGQVMGLIESIYPNAKKLSATGDLIVHEEAYYDKKTKTNFVHQIGVVRTADEKFYVYGREINLATGESRSRRLSPFAHSPEALNNYIITQTVIKRDRKNKTLWFNKANKRSHSYFIQDEGQITFEDGTTEPIHRREEPVHRDLVEAIRAAISQEDLSNQVIQAIYQDIARFGVGETALRKIQTDYNLDESSFAAIIDTLNAHESTQYKVRSYGVYVSADFEIPVEKGDTGWHRNEKTGEIRYGVVIRRQGTHSSKIYGYSDYLTFAPLVGSDADGNPIYGDETNITSKNFTIDKTAAGTDGSERISAARDLINVPVSKPAVDTPAPKPPMEPAKPKVKVTIDRSEPSKPTVEVNGEAKPATANRTTSIKNFNPEDIDAAQLQAGDFFMTMDPEMGIPRLAEVVSTEFDDEAGKFKVTAIIPDNNTTATAFEQEWDVDANNGLSGQRMIAYRRPVPEPTVASDDTVQELLRAMRAHDVSFLSAEDAAEIGDFTSRYINGEELTQEEVDALLGKLAETPLRNAAPTPVATAIQAAQDIVDADADSGDRDELQNVVDEAKIKESELPEDSDEPNVLTGFTIKRNANGIYYPEGGIKKGSKLYKAIRRGEVIPPKFPFITSDTDWGGVMYFDSNGNRHWGQFGAAGAVLRVKDANGDYKYLLARRAKGMSTGGGKWSVPGGAHDDLADKSTPVVTSARELYEELGIDPTGMTVAGGAKKTVAPDWEYDYSILDTPDETIIDGIDLKKNPEISELGWFTADEIRALQANDEMHGDVDSQILDDIFAVGDAPVTDPVVIDETIFTPDVEPDGFVDLTGFAQTAGKGGSNPGGTFQAPDGKKYYAKFQRSDMHAANEVAAARLYNAAGVPAIDINHGALEGKDNVTQSAIIYVDRNKSPQLDAALRDKTQEGFAIDAWLANWDGVVNDNTLADANGDPIRMDVGGSLLFRAQGSAKGAQFGDTVTEIDSLRDPRVNANAAAVYGSMTDADIAESSKKLLNISEEDIDDIVDDAFAGVDSANKADVDALKATLKARRKDILNRFGLSEGGEPTPEDTTDGEADADVTPEVTDVTPEVEQPAAPQVDADADAVATTKAPEATYRPNEPASMDRNFNAIMDNLNAINDSADGDSIRIEYGTVNEAGQKEMHILGVRKVNGEWKTSKEGEADKYLFDRDNGVVRLTNDELIAKIDALGAGDPNTSKVLRFGSRANQDGTTLTSQMIEYAYSDANDYNISPDVPTQFYSDSEQRSYVLKRDITNNYNLAFFSSDDTGISYTVSISEMQKRAASGEVFKLGRPRGETAPGSVATDEWIDNPRPGDMMFSTRNSTAPMAETFTADDNGNWISSYTGKPVPAATLKQSSLYTGDPMTWLARSNYIDLYSFIGFDTTARGGVRTASKASKEVIEGLQLNELFTDGTDTYRVVPGGARSFSFLNVKTGDTVDRVAMRKNWDLNGKKFKFLTGLEGVNIGDTITEPAAAKKPIVGTTFQRESEFKLPFFKSGEKSTQYFTFDGSKWRDNAGEWVSTEAVQAYIQKGEVTLSSSDIASQVAATSSEDDATPAVRTPATSGDVTRLDQKIQRVSPELSKHFPTDTIQKMSQEEIASMEAFISENVDSEGNLPASAVGEAAIMFSPDIKISGNRKALLEVMRQLDSTDHGSRGRTFRQLLDTYEDAKAKSDFRKNNLNEAHPLKGLGERSNEMMEIVNSLFPEISERPDSVSTKSELENYDSPSEVLFRGVTQVRYTNEDGETAFASGEELQRLFREADGTWWGYGVYGHGLYAAENQMTALNSYAAGNLKAVGVFKIKTDANILTSESSSDEQHTLVNSYAKQMITAYLISIGLVPGSTEFNNAYNQLQADIFSDAGPRAAFFGYDALYIANNRYYVLLNRAAAVVYDGTLQEWRTE